MALRQLVFDSFSHLPLNPVSGICATVRFAIFRRQRTTNHTYGY